MLAKRKLGRTGLEVSALGLGCMGMSMAYGKTDDAESLRTLQIAIDLGVTFIDTADMYGWGHNEKLISKAIKGQRNQLVIATKMGFIQEGGSYRIDTSPSYIKAACEASLKRLEIEKIDLYYLHRADGVTPIEDSIGALVELIKEGKICHIGLSEMKPETIRQAAKIHPITALQTEYSLWQRKPEAELLPLCKELGIGFVPYSPLGRGFLTSTVTDLNSLAADDFRRQLPRFQRKNFVANLKLANVVKELATQKHCTPAQLALAWLLDKGENIVPIPGTKRQKYLIENLGALQVNLTTDEINFLEEQLPPSAIKDEQYPESLRLER